ncbi:MAG: hypothetical protein V4549_03510 [Bacteroidota bacterium]
MADTNIYGRSDITIEFTDTDPVPLSVNRLQFKRIIVQTADDNNADVLVGGSDPSIKLISGASEKFYNGELDSIYVSGAIGDVVNVHVEF